jgi:hypothetical protein
MDEMITASAVATVVVGLVRYAWKGFQHYVPNWRERIEMRQKTIDVMRELGLTNAEIRQHLGFDSAPKQLSLGRGEPPQIGCLEFKPSADSQ